MELNGKKLLITGIAGFIGRRMAELALDRGMIVRGLQRSQSKAQQIEQLGIDVVVGSVTDPAACRAACAGVDIVLHTAALAKEQGSLPDFRAVNVEGTAAVATAAKAAGVKTFVHLSSVMVYGFSYADQITETGPLRGDNNPYCQTKIEGEQVLLALNSPPEFGIIIIRPGDVYGPGSIPWVIRPVVLMRKRMFILANSGRGVMNHVYIDNLIEAIFLAIEHKPYGQAFNITDGQETSWKDYFTRLAEIEGIHLPFSLPASSLKALIRLHGLTQTVLGQTRDPLPGTIDFVTRPHAYSINKAKTELAYQPRISLEEGMKLTKDWLHKTDLESCI
ncbi:MAG: NAD-dependent epimerase/dehydratase family protein [Cyanobacteria bacterium P01_D01_bin.44]